MGDLNARTGSKNNDATVGRYGEQITNTNGQFLIDLCQGMSLKIVNGFFPHKNIHKFTWTQPTRGLSSIIDYIIMKQDSKINNLDVRVHRGSECGSDHHLVVTKLVINYRRKMNKKAEDVESSSDSLDEKKYNLESLKDESTQFLYKLRLATKLQLVKKGQSARELYNELKICIHEAAEEALGRKRKTQKNAEWWTKQVEEIVKEKKKAYLYWLNTKRDEDRKTYMKLNREAKRQVQQRKNEHWEKRCEEVGRFMGGTKVSEAWKVIKSLRKNTKESAKINLIGMETWRTYYKTLLTENRPEFQMGNIDINLDEQIHKITKTEIKGALKESKNKKAAGPGDIPIELMKNAPDILIDLLEELFNRCIQGEQIPDDWNLGYISSIHKKGDKKLCQNYRGITVVNAMGRLYGRILKKRIEGNIQEIEEQSGFRTGRSCMDNVFVLQQIMEKRKAHNLTTHLIFIDLEKAYDTVPLKKLFQILKKTGLNNTYIRAIWNLYKDATSVIKMGAIRSEPFSINKGLKQGCSLSPTLFKIYIQEALSEWRNKIANMGLYLDDKCLTSLFFADDQVIIACDEDDADYMLRKLKDEYENWGLNINMQKTEYMKVGGKQEDEDPELQIRGIKRTTNYKYLGSILTEEGNTKADIKNRAQQGRKATRSLNSLLWSKSIRTSTKIRIYEAVVEPILTYGAECWQMTKNDRKVIDTVEMDFLRRACQVSKIEHIRNEDIRRRTKRIYTSIDRIETRQLIWYGHVQRMNEERWPKKAFQYTPKNRRKRGRPMNSWTNGINSIMKDRGIKEDEWRDKDKWRSKCGMRQRL